MSAPNAIGTSRSFLGLPEDGPDIELDGVQALERYMAERAVWDAANRVKDRQDEALDAMRVHNGMTLDEFLDRTQRGRE